MIGQISTQTVGVAHQIKQFLVALLKLYRLVEVVDGVHVARIFDRVHADNVPEDRFAPETQRTETVPRVVCVELESRLQTTDKNTSNH